MNIEGMNNTALAAGIIVIIAIALHFGMAFMFSGSVQF